MADQHFLQGHLCERDAPAQFCAELVGGEKVYLFGRILDLIQKVRDFGIKQWFSAGDEHLLRLESPDSLHVKVMNLFRDTLFIQLAE
jgi:hypothetical protein